jgi:hypothetical protein
MNNVRYYQQVPIMKRILDHVENSVYVLGNPPNEPASHFRKYSDIMNAMGEGSDLYRSQLDFSGVNFFMDVEYGNSTFPGEIFHNPIDAFGKIEGLRMAIREFLDRKGIPFLELMTGQGYNYVTKVRRDSASYSALIEVGRKLKVLPWSAAEKLLQKEEQHGNVPLLRDALAFGALGRVAEYMYDEVKSKYNELPLEPTDIHEHDEIAILDMTQYGYMIYNRAQRIAFSLHQKSSKRPDLGYGGPPISTITPSGLTLEQRIQVRSDERNNYEKAANLAREARTAIPEADISYLLASYLMSQKYEAHKNTALSMPEKQLREDEEKHVKSLYPEMKTEGTFWEVPSQPDWKKINSAHISYHARNIINFPNDLMLIPGNIKHLIDELTEHSIPRQDILSLMAFKYSEAKHGWNADLASNDPMLRADYWIRTMLDEL